jgi:glutathione S-transferase
MTDLILHHFDASPFSEKVRLMLGFKGLAWHSVKVPMIMPKPDVVALTGGYRKTPFVQIGADIYCDTALVARLLDSLVPAPTLFPASAPLAPLLEQWADSLLFSVAVPFATQPAGRAAILAGVPPEILKGLAADRAAFMAGQTRQTVADAGAALAQHLSALDAQLADGRSHLLGAEASVADFAVAHCLWFVRLGGTGVAAVFEPFPHVSAWLDRVLSIGHGRSTAMDSGQAVAVAAAATPQAPVAVHDALGFLAGDAVTVSATDYGTDAVAGLLVGLSNETVVVARQDARAGLVHVHFPRRGYQIRKTQP